MREINRPLVTKLRRASSWPWLVQYPTGSSRYGARLVEANRFQSWEAAYTFARGKATVPLDVA